MDNVVLIRRVEILANVQKACHLRIHTRIMGANSFLMCKNPGLLPDNTWKVRVHLITGTDWVTGVIVIVIPPYNGGEKGIGFWPWHMFK